ncbi:phosphotransferase [Rossellomorea aquimaris]|uniref:phosphotransferase n=1 Tax=Rossellomorea aquimaris TaxID=189382 RepID=UPI0007D089CE|nr:phosphotransferase [Rossellomorea aquimaris]
MNDKLKTKIQEVIGEVYSVTFLDEQGCTSEVRKLNTGKGLYLLKSSFKEKYRPWLESEAQLLEKLNHKGMAVPHYYGFIKEKDSSHLLMSFEKGMTLTAALKAATSLSEKKTLIRSFGEFLHDFHEMNPLDSFEKKDDWLDDQLDKAKNYVENGQADGTIQLLEKLMSHKPLPVKQTMIHGDCTIDNVLVVDGKVKLFIDVAGMTVGDPRYDESLAIRKFLNNPEYINSFYEGYKRYKVTNAEFQYFNEGLYEFF